MATLNLGRIKPVFRGAYAGGTAYVVDDIVTSGNETFICILASTGNATSNATYWTKLAAKGGDVTQLTTQGDILYRDGSGVARLAAGLDGQALLSGGAGANPSWGAATAAMQSVVTAATLTAVAGKAYPINTTSNACVVTLPASATAGDTIEFLDYARKWGTNSVTLEQGLLKYQGYTQAAGKPAVYSKDGTHITLVYVDATQGWIPTIDDDVSIESDPPITATGGTITTYTSGGINYKVHTFLTSTNFVVTAGGAMDIFMVGGGGGGSGYHAGGGGAGGLIECPAASNTISPATYAIVVGGASTQGVLVPGGQGNDTTGFGETCNGGGFGGNWNTHAATAGGSGGGAQGGTGSPPGSINGGAGNQGNPTTLTGTGYGFDGGDGFASHWGGGGGGAGSDGDDGINQIQGDGGIGRENSFRTCKKNKS